MEDADTKSAGSTAVARECFRAAARAFQDLVSSISQPAWGSPGLGTWDVRSLVGHTSRALSTIETYLGRPAGPAELFGPADYFLSVRSADKEAVADRGRQAGEALGSDPASAILDLADRVQSLVDRTNDEVTVATAGGSMRFIDYLPTRTFELTVHSLDIAQALGQPAPADLRQPVAACCELAGALAGRLPESADLLLLITGRPRLTDGLGVV